MDYVVVEGVPPYDGRFEFDIEGQELTTREWGWIKRLAGYLPAELGDENKFGDPELITVFAAIALRRAGKVENQGVPQLFQRLSDAPFGSAILLETDTEQETDASPPPPSSNGNAAASGISSPTSSETSAPTPNSSGTPGSATSGFDQLTSAT